MKQQAKSDGANVNCGTVFHVEIDLCGQVFVRNLMKPHHDVLSIVLKVLNSIEFLDDVSRNPSETPLR